MAVDGVVSVRTVQLTGYYVDENRYKLIAWFKSVGERMSQICFPRIKASDAEALICSLTCAWTNGWVNKHEAGDLRRHDAHYDVTAMLRLRKVEANGTRH